MPTQRLESPFRKKPFEPRMPTAAEKCGVKFNIMGERLVVHSENMPIDLLLVRDDDIQGLIMDGVVDLGFIGENVLEEVRLGAKQRRDCVSVRNTKTFGISVAVVYRP